MYILGALVLIALTVWLVVDNFIESDRTPEFVEGEQVRPEYSPEDPDGRIGTGDYDPNANVLPSPVEPGADVGDAQGVPVDFGFDPRMVDLKESYERLTTELGNNKVNVMPFVSTLSRNILGFVQEQDLNRQPRIREAMLAMQEHVDEMKTNLQPADQAMHLKQTAQSMVDVMQTVQQQAFPKFAQQVRAMQQAAARLSASQPVNQQTEAVKAFFRSSLDALSSMAQSDQAQFEDHEEEEPRVDRQGS